MDRWASFSPLSSGPSSGPTTPSAWRSRSGTRWRCATRSGKVAAEEVEVYPPGIPLILEGFRVGQDAVDYLEQARASGGSIVARDTHLQTLRVL